MMFALTRLSRTHTWILPVFAVGLGAPLWCQVRRICFTRVRPCGMLMAFWIDLVGNVFACALHPLGGLCGSLPRSLAVALAWCLGCRSGCRTWNDSPSGEEAPVGRISGRDTQSYHPLIRHYRVSTSVRLSCWPKSLVQSVSWSRVRRHPTRSDPAPCSPTSAPGTFRKAFRAVRWPSRCSGSP